MTSERVPAMSVSLLDLPEAVRRLAVRSALSAATAAAPGTTRMPADAGECAAALGLSCERLDIEGADLGSVLPLVAPCIAETADGRFVPVLRAKGERAWIVTPTDEVVAVAMDDLQRLTVPAWPEREAGLAGAIDALGLPTAGRRASVSALVASVARRDGLPVRLWQLRGTDDGRSLRTKAAAFLVGMTVAKFVHAAALLGLWWTLAEGLLAARAPSGWLPLALLLVLTAGAFDLFALGLQGRLARIVGAASHRYFFGRALSLNEQRAKQAGSADVFSRVMETQDVDHFGMAALGAAVGLVFDAVLALVVLAQASAPGPLFAALAFAVILAAWVIRQYLARNDEVVNLRVALSGLLVEAVAGNRTRMAQVHPEDWHQREDRMLGAYARASQGRDAWRVALHCLPRLWLLLGVAMVGWRFLHGDVSSGTLALVLASVVLAYGAFRGLQAAAENLAAMRGAWLASAPLRAVDAVLAKTDAAPPPLRIVPSSTSGAPILELRNVSFTYPGRRTPAVVGANITIRRGEHLLIRGPSGGGKSTLASLMSAQVAPGEGTVLMDGLDPASMGIAAWRRKVALCPQFHQNDLFVGTLAFNLLMGRRWPATAQDLDDAAKVCEGLGLGPVLKAMPMGLYEIVGESGWRLSHGERNRIFVARTLLQDAELVVFDESFSALDPSTQTLALACALRMAKTVVVIAHP